ncbi:Blue-light-activated protein [Andreprevotia sp. IGB-42]|uniref:hybrid sensor histidine kinase/response regulator n=1 Tax=Andreprevotia sp. IGB-42 TaxID=2497473 RepID=UPI001359652C|nr:ATP-binding protein [Andreprevotia sp. IGB-42]KAF0813529.1 Blue-light-activated protein [Andreprevotia sp. IGB-42]
MPNTLDFLSDGGEMGELIRAHDWAGNTLGSPAQWPQSLRTVVRLMLNTRHPMYIFWGAEGTCLYNDAYRLSIGPERHPCSLGQPARAVWEEIWGAIGPQFEQVMRGDGATWHENQLVPITRNGRREDVYWTYSYSPIDDESAPNGVGGVLVLCTETTRLVEAERARRQNDERLQMALSAGNSIGTWDWDVANDRVQADARFAGLYGVDPQRAVAGAPIADFFTAVHPDDAPMLRVAIDNALATGDVFAVEYRLLHPDGSVQWVAAQGRCSMAADGTPLHFPGVSFDISARKVAEERLQQLNQSLESQVHIRTAELIASEAHWRSIFEQLQEGFVLAELVHDHNGKAKDFRYLEINPAWEKLVGIPREQALGQLGNNVVPDQEPEWLARYAHVVETGEATAFTRHVKSLDRWYHLHIFRPEPGRFAVLFFEVTEQRRAEEALRQSQKMEAVGQLTGGLAHDFNNLLAGISGSLQLMQLRMSQGRVNELDRYVSTAFTATKRAAALTHRLLAFSRRQTLDPMPTNANRLILGMEELIRRTVGPAITLAITPAAGLWHALVDPHQLENALLNLCINARDAMPDGGNIAIATANRQLDERTARVLDIATGDYLMLSVTDSGTGMAAQTVARAFEPFFTTKPLGEGTGLGLSMIYGFARQSGGQVRIDSFEGQGTTVSIYLPRHDGDLEDDDINLLRPVAARAIQGETVLVVDDEPSVRLLVTEVLEDLGYTAIEAADSVAGLKVLQSDVRIDLLISDVGLPGGMNGRQMADAGRTSRPGLKVLFITGYAEASVLGEGRLAPGMQVLTKPFVLETLAARIKELVAG